MAQLNKSKTCQDSELIEWIKGALTQACDTAMAQRCADLNGEKNSPYWWTENLMELRKHCHTLHRALKRRIKKRKATSRKTLKLSDLYRTKRMEYKKEITRAKEVGWRKLLQIMESNLQSKPYCVTIYIMYKIKDIPDTGMLTLQNLERIIKTLFPAENQKEEVNEDIAEEELTEELKVNETELWKALKRVASLFNAPGPNSTTGPLWNQAVSILGKDMLKIFIRCLELGKFPPEWSLARQLVFPESDKPIVDDSDSRRSADDCD